MSIFVGYSKNQDQNLRVDNTGQKWEPNANGPIFIILFVICKL
jgi:hypothetical protein